jgi:hypothetical protein
MPNISEGECYEAIWLGTKYVVRAVKVSTVGGDPYIDVFVVSDGDRHGEFLLLHDSELGIRVEDPDPVKHDEYTREARHEATRTKGYVRKRKHK